MTPKGIYTIMIVLSLIALAAVPFLVRELTSMVPGY
jgi:hypothetical protein